MINIISKHTVKTEIIENDTRTLEFPPLVRSVFQVRAKGESPRTVSFPKSKAGNSGRLSAILNYLDSYSILNND